VQAAGGSSWELGAVRVAHDVTLSRIKLDTSIGDIGQSIISQSPVVRSQRSRLGSVLLKRCIGLSVLTCKVSKGVRHFELSPLPLDFRSIEACSIDSCSQKRGHQNNSEVHKDSGLEHMAPPL